MPVIKVWLLPDMEQTQFERLYDALWEGVESVSELGLRVERPQDITFLFPKDHMQKGLGEDGLIEVSQLTPKPERTPEVKQRLARVLSGVVRAFCPNMKFMEVFIEEEKPDTTIYTYDKEAE